MELNACKLIIFPIIRHINIKHSIPFQKHKSNHEWENMNKKTNLRLRAAQRNHQQRYQELRESKKKSKEIIVELRWQTRSNLADKLVLIIEQCVCVCEDNT